MRKAFTLIELLVVIGIISILAMIALPNFLEAQIRAKVSRCMADMHSLATAIESYNVDYNQTPLDWRVCTHVGAVGDPPLTLAQGQEMESRELTTPIAYITSLPDDPFKAGGWEFAMGKYFKYRYLSYRHWALGPLGPSVDDGGHPHFTGAASMGYMWSLSSIGPYRKGARFDLNDTNSPWEPRVISGQIATGGLDEYGEKDYIYDPTNGISSFGLIIRTNKGHFTGVPGT